MEPTDSELWRENYNFLQELDKLAVYYNDTLSKDQIITSMQAWIIERIKENVEEDLV